MENTEIGPRQVIRKKGERTPGPDGRAHGLDCRETLLRLYPTMVMPYETKEMTAYMWDTFDLKFQTPNTKTKKLSHLAAQLVGQASSQDDRQVIIESITFETIARMYSLGLVFVKTTEDKWCLRLDYLETPRSTNTLASAHIVAQHIWSRFIYGLSCQLYGLYEADKVEQMIAKVIEDSPAVGWSRSDMLKSLRMAVGGKKIEGERQTIPLMADHCARLMCRQFDAMKKEVELAREMYRLKHK